jgi:hypothetical protein
MKNTGVAPFSGINGFMVLPFFSPLRLDFWTAGPEETKNPAGQKCPPPDSDPLATPSLEKICGLGKTNRPARESRE